jgi:hypothetical protein
MELSALAKKYGDFYAPSCVVRLGQGSDVMRDLLIPVSQVEVDLALGGTSRFHFTVTDSYDRKLQNFKSGRGDDVLDILKLGAEVEICMGYGDAKSTPTALHGVITEVGISFPEGGSPELSIAGYDLAHTLTRGTNSQTWKDTRDSAAVRDVARRHKLGTDIQTTEEVRRQIEQNNECDWAFLRRLANQNDFELYIDEQKRLHFRERNNRAAAVVDLVYGQSLLSFMPVANLAGQVSGVEVFGWNPETKKPIVGQAKAGQESGLTGKSGGQHLDAFVGDPSKRPTLRLRQPVFTQAEADQRARAAHNERARKFLTGEGESLGLPELRPDRNVRLDKLGKLFSKTYYIQKVTHKIDTNGYRTRFNVEETGL